MVSRTLGSQGGLEGRATICSSDLACNRCDRRGWLNTARPVAERGANKSIPELLRILSADYPTRQAVRVGRGTRPGAAGNRVLVPLHRGFDRLGVDGTVRSCQSNPTWL